MAEWRKPQPSRLDIIRATGIVPERLLWQVGENGIQYDYRNHWFAVNVLHPRYNPQAPNNRLLEDNAGEEIRRLIRTTKTYSDYWRERLGRYNERERGTDQPLTNSDAVFNLLVTQQPKARTLDLLAQRAHELADSRMDPTTLIKAFVKLTAQSYIILYNRKEARDLLREFGIIEKDTITTEEY